MSNQTKFPKLGNKSWSRRVARLVVMFLLFPVAALVVERLRGAWAFKAWAREMTAKGAILEARKLWPPRSAAVVDFTNSLNRALQGLPEGIRKYTGQISCFVPGQLGGWQRGSQQARPMLRNGAQSEATWNDVDAAVKEAEPILAAVRQLMTNPPAGIGYDVSTMLENDTTPNLFFVRIGAQALQTAVCRDLHNHNLAGAVENLRALEGFTRLGKNDPGLVCLMSRVAVLGIAIEVLWDALQAEG